VLHWQNDGAKSEKNVSFKHEDLTKLTELNEWQSIAKLIANKDLLKAAQDSHNLYLRQFIHFYQPYKITCANPQLYEFRNELNTSIKNQHII
jgi:hypothetical protein